MHKSIGILTGGGDAPGINAVIRAVVRASHESGYDIIGFKDGYTGLLKNEFVRLRSGDVSGVLDKGGTLLGTSGDENLLTQKDEEKINGVIQTIKENMSMNDMEGILIVGGNEAITSAGVLKRNGVNVIAIPKSICNNIYGTDTALGFKTAIDTATEAIDKLHSTADSHHRVMIIEVAGKDAGWIALESGIAGGADVVLIPEIPYNINKVARAVMKRKNENKSFSIIVVCQSSLAIDNENTEKSKPVYVNSIGATGAHIADELMNLIGIESDVTVLGQLLQGGRPSPYDRLLSTSFGAMGIHMALDGDYGKCVCEQGAEVVAVPLEEIDGKINRINPNGYSVTMGKRLGICFGD